MTYPVTPAAIPRLADVIAGQEQWSAELQIGKVVKASPSGVFVAPGGDGPAVQVGYLRNIYHPVLGETVGIIRQGASWLVLGPIAGPEDAMMEVQNFSFQESPAGSFPAGWTLVSSAGSPSATTENYLGSDWIDGDQVGSINAVTATSIDTSLYSSVIPVVAGERWGLGAYFRPNDNFGANAATLRLYASFFPTSSISSPVLETSHFSWVIHRGHQWRVATENGEAGAGATVPPGAAFLRVRIRLTWTSAASDAVYIDRVTARRMP